MCRSQEHSRRRNGAYIPWTTGSGQVGGTGRDGDCDQGWKTNRVEKECDGRSSRYQGNPMVRSLDVSPGLRDLNVGVQPSDGRTCLSAPGPKRAHSEFVR